MLPPPSAQLCAEQPARSAWGARGGEMRKGNPAPRPASGCFPLRQGHQETRELASDPQSCNLSLSFQAAHGWPDSQGWLHSQGARSVHNMVQKSPHGGSTPTTDVSPKPCLCKPAPSCRSRRTGLPTPGQRPLSPFPLPSFSFPQRSRECHPLADSLSTPLLTHPDQISPLQPDPTLVIDPLSLGPKVYQEDLSLVPHVLPEPLLTAKPGR